LRKKLEKIKNLIKKIKKMLISKKIFKNKKNAQNTKKLEKIKNLIKKEKK